MATECKAVTERAMLTAQITMCQKPMLGLDSLIKVGDGLGTEEGLLEAMDILTGIVNEYRDGGDQMVEACTCGEHMGDLPTTINLKLPFEMNTGQIKLEPGTEHSSALEELERMAELGDHELPRVLLAAVALFEMGAGPIGACLHTAVIWERG